MNTAQPQAMAQQSETNAMNGLVVDFAKHHHLTPREQEVCVLISKGLKNTSIARQLGISDTTVRLHITGIHHKLGTGNKVDLVIELWKWSLDQQSSH